MERRTLRRIVVNRLDEISSLRERRRKGREGVSGCEQEEGREDEEEKRREEGDSRSSGEACMVCFLCKEEEITIIFLSSDVWEVDGLSRRCGNRKKRKREETHPLLADFLLLILLNLVDNLSLRRYRRRVFSFDSKIKQRRRYVPKR